MENNNQVEGKKSCNIHWSCCFFPLLGSIAWIAGLLSVVYAWISISNGQPFWGLGAAEWFWSALTLGVLAMSASRKKMGSCRCGGCGSSKCGGCEGGVCK
jgi:hypothetical protein